MCSWPCRLFKNLKISNILTNIKYLMPRDFSSFLLNYTFVTFRLQGPSNWTHLGRREVFKSSTISSSTKIYIERGNLLIHHTDIYLLTQKNILNVERSIPLFQNSLCCSPNTWVITVSPILWSSLPQHSPHHCCPQTELTPTPKSNLFPPIPLYSPLLARTFPLTLKFLKYLKFPIPPWNS